MNHFYFIPDLSGKKRRSVCSIFINCWLLTDSLPKTLEVVCSFNIFVDHSHPLLFASGLYMVPESNFISSVFYLVYMEYTAGSSQLSLGVPVRMSSQGIVRHDWIQGVYYCFIVSKTRLLIPGQLFGCYDTLTLLSIFSSGWCARNNWDTQKSWN